MLELLWLIYGNGAVDKAARSLEMGKHLALLAMVVLCAARSGADGFIDSSVPEDSPYWWGLTDETSPAELRARLLDPSGHYTRLNQSVAKGQTPPVNAGDISFYLDPRLTPELVPMWLAFNIFALDVVEIQGAETVADSLAGHGISKDGISAILKHGKEYELAHAAALEAAQQETKQFLAFETRTITKLDTTQRSAYHAAKEAGDVAELARLSGEDPKTVASLYAAWNRDPAAVEGAKSIKALHGAVSAPDWKAFRAYLLSDVVSGMGPVLDIRETGA